MIYLEPDVLVRHHSAFGVRHPRAAVGFVAARGSGGGQRHEMGGDRRKSLGTEGGQARADSMAGP